MTDKTQIFVIEPSSGGIIILEAEGQRKDGKYKDRRVSNFKTPRNALNYLKEKFGISTKE